MAYQISISALHSACRKAVHEELERQVGLQDNVCWVKISFDRDEWCSFTFGKDASLIIDGEPVEFVD